MGFGPRTTAVYRWEQERVYPYDKSCLGEGQIKGVVDYVWTSYGLRNPPKVEFKRGGWHYGDRLTLTFGDRVNTVIVLHEICHALDMSVEAVSGIKDARTREYYDEDAHGPNWLGLYVNALDKFMPQPEFRKLFLMGELTRRGLDFALAPKLRCL